VVFQDDCLFATMTVKEHLLYAANLRLAGIHTPDEINEIVNRVQRRWRGFVCLSLAFLPFCLSSLSVSADVQIIDSLRLRECKTNLIGDDMIPGISGGM
jgi:hypothetical protein